MSIQIRLLTWWRGQYVGQDAYGNTYYQDKKVSREGRIRRWVIYKGVPEATKIPPEWHGWLHYATDEIPEANDQLYAWQRPHQRNLTGTRFAYRPRRQKKLQVFTPWHP